MQIDENEYKQLIEIKSKYSMLLKSLYNNARLNYREDDLDFSYSDIEVLVKYLEPEIYERKIDELLEEKKLKKEKNNG